MDDIAYYVDILNLCDLAIADEIDQKFHQARKIKDPYLKEKAFKYLHVYLGPEGLASDASFKNLFADRESGVDKETFNLEQFRRNEAWEKESSRICSDMMSYFASEDLYSSFGIKEDNTGTIPCPYLVVERDNHLAQELGVEDIPSSPFEYLFVCLYDSSVLIFPVNPPDQDHIQGVLSVSRSSITDFRQSFSSAFYEWLKKWDQFYQNEDIYSPD